MNKWNGWKEILNMERKLMSKKIKEYQKMKKMRKTWWLTQQVSLPLLGRAAKIFGKKSSIIKSMLFDKYLRVQHYKLFIYCDLNLLVVVI